MSDTVTLCALHYLNSSKKPDPNDKNHNYLRKVNALFWHAEWSTYKILQGTWTFGTGKPFGYYTNCHGTIHKKTQGHIIWQGTQKMEHDNLAHQNHEHFTGVVLKTQITRTHIRKDELLAVRNFIRMNTAIPPTHPHTLKAHHAQRVRQQRIWNGKELFDELLFVKIDEAVIHHMLCLTFLKSWTLLSCEANIFLQVS